MTVKIKNCLLMMICICLIVSICCCNTTTGSDVISTSSNINESSSESVINESQIESLTNELTEQTSSEIIEPIIQSTVESTESIVSDNTLIPPVEPITPDTPHEQPKESLPLFEYIVNDPDNLRCLSTDRRGFSFGVAQNGIPHEQSVTNQETFDSFDNVRALALDNKTDQKIMYLTFDNGYEYQNLTASILDTLKQKDVKAAFFITLSYAKNNKELVQRMIDEGHIVGNHSATHPDCPTLTRNEMALEIAQLDNYLRKNFSYTSPYFRFPSGAYSENCLELVTSIGFNSVFWSIAYSDWDTSNQKGEENAYLTVTSRFHPGAVILLHAVSQDNTLALGRIIDTALAEGYTFATLDNYFK